MKYQFKLAVLASAKKQKYVERLKDFIYKYGFKFTNKDTINIKIVFLAENEDAPNFILNNPLFEWVDVKEKLSTRFIKYIEQSKIDYEWIMQVDDDSSTDIDRSYELLNDFYDYVDPMMFLCSRTPDMDYNQQLILREMEIKNIFFGNIDINNYKDTPYFIHSWEGSLFSCGGAMKIKNHSILPRYLELTDKYLPGYGDNTPAVVAKICKVPVVESLFMSAWAHVEDYSAITPTGKLTHIHYVLKDWEGYQDFIDKMQENRSVVFNTNFKDMDSLKPAEWLFGRKDGQANLVYAAITLDNDGSIKGYWCDNEKYWSLEDDGKIVFFNKDKEKTTVFSKINDTEYNGTFLQDNKTIHFLKKRMR